MEGVYRRMNADFPRIISLLRKEKGISQKKAAAELGISQALLSHYEKGIRECGLDFLVRCSRFYNVSTDYMLGISPDRNGVMLSVEDIPDPEAAGKENVMRGSILPVLNKKLISNSLNILYDFLAKSGNKELINEVSSFLMLSIYRMFRQLHGANKRNQEAMFTVRNQVYTHYAEAVMLIKEANIQTIAQGDKRAGENAMKSTDCFFMDNKSLAETYPLFVSSLLNLIKNAEEQIKTINIT